MNVVELPIELLKQRARAGDREALQTLRDRGAFPASRLPLECPASWAQQRMWIAVEKEQPGLSYAIALARRVRGQLDEDALREAVALLDAAIKRDPNYANAYRLKARSLELLATSYPKNPEDMAATLAKAELAAKRAIAIAPKLGSAYAELALIEQDRFQYASSWQSMERALKLSPDDPLVIPSAMYVTRYFGDANKALKLADRLIALDPLEGVNYTRRADVLLVLRQYPQAIESARKSLELTPGRSSTRPPPTALDSTDGACRAKRRAKRTENRPPRRRRLLRLY